MARNWKRAHDKLKVELADALTKSHELRFLNCQYEERIIAIERDRSARGDKLDITVDAMLGAAENFDAHKIHASARSLRHAVSALGWSRAMCATEERKR